MDSRNLYKNLFVFLSDIYSKEKIDDLGCLLGDMRLLDDNISCDPALFHDWERICTHSQINDDIIYEKCITFLNEYATRINSKELFKFIASIDKEMMMYFIKSNKYK